MMDILIRKIRVIVITILVVAVIIAINKQVAMVVFVFMAIAFLGMRILIGHFRKCERCGWYITCHAEKAPVLKDEKLHKAPVLWCLLCNHEKELTVNTT